MIKKSPKISRWRTAFRALPFLLALATIPSLAGNDPTEVSATHELQMILAEMDLLDQQVSRQHQAGGGLGSEMGADPGNGAGGLACGPQSFSAKIVTHCSPKGKCQSVINPAGSGGTDLDQKALETAVRSGVYQCHIDSMQTAFQSGNLSLLEFGPAAGPVVTTTQVTCERASKEPEVPRNLPPVLASSSSSSNFPGTNPLPWNLLEGFKPDLPARRPPPPAAPSSSSTSSSSSSAPQNPAQPPQLPQEQGADQDAEHRLAIERAKSLHQLFSEHSQALTEGLEQWDRQAESQQTERTRIYHSLQGYKEVQTALLEKETSNQPIRSNPKEDQQLRQERRWIVQTAAELGLSSLSKAVQQLTANASEEVSALLERNEGFLGLAKRALDVGISLTPLSTGRDLYEALTGNDLWTGEELSLAERSSAVAGVLTASLPSKIKNTVRFLHELKDVLSKKHKAHFLASKFNKSLQQGKNQAKAEASFPSRKAAFKQAKRDAGIPVTQQPNQVSREALKEGREKIIEKGKVVETRNYHYPSTSRTGKDTATKEVPNEVVIQEHSRGHTKGDVGPHFNTRPDQREHGCIEGAQDHYPF